MIKQTLLILALLGVVSCSDKPNNNEEIEKNLSEIKQQLLLVTQEVVQLRQEFAQVKNSENEQEKVQSLTELALFSDELTKLGTDKAEYAIVEYMDYQCPYCLRHAEKVLPALKRKYIDSGLVQYIVRDFPLEFHTEAKSAAKLAQCSAQQDEFYAAHQLLIAKSRELGRVPYASLASELTLDLDKFEQCFNDPILDKKLDLSLITAAKLGVSRTPRFFIGKIEGSKLVNVISLSGARSKETFEQALAHVFNVNN